MKADYFHHVTSLVNAHGVGTYTAGFFALRRMPQKAALLAQIINDERQHLGTQSCLTLYHEEVAVCGDLSVRLDLNTF